MTVTSVIGKNSESESENIDKQHPYEMHVPIQEGIQTLFTTLLKYVLIIINNLYNNFKAF
jgi:hypothetical protein